jgi:hypothetical protein
MFEKKSTTCPVESTNELLDHLGPCLVKEKDGVMLAVFPNFIEPNLCNVRAYLTKKGLMVHAQGWQTLA